MYIRTGGIFLVLVMIANLGYAQIQVSLLDTTTNWISQVTIPLRINDVTSYDIYSYELTVKYDTLILRPTGADHNNTIAAIWLLPVYNDSIKGTLIIGDYATNKLDGSGRLVNLSFDVIGNPDDISNLTFTYFQFNNGILAISTINGSVKIGTNLITASVVQGNAILLEWTPSLVTTIYNVYRDTVYNFVPDTLNGSNRIGYHINDEDPNKSGIQWTDTGNGIDIVGDVTKNYFYKITAVTEIESAMSNVAGEFDYNLITTNGTDINEIVVVLDTRNSSNAILTAEDLAQAAIPNCSDVYYWDAAGQGIVGHVVGLRFSNFAVRAGYLYYVNVTSATMWSTAGSG